MASMDQFGTDPMAMRRALALRLLSEGTDTSPIRSWTQGAARLAQAITGGYMANQDLQQQQDATKQLGALLASNQPQAAQANSAPSATQDGMLPRGLRNNNPGNIEDGTFAQSQPGYQGTDGRFAKFASADQGMGALDSLLKNYGQKGINTVGGVINRYAPPSDNNPTSAYASTVAQKLDVTPDAPIDLNDPNVRQTLAQGIGRFENGPAFGMQPGSAAPALPPPVQVAQNAPPAAPQAAAQQAQPDIKSKIAQLLASNNPYAQKLGQQLAMTVVGQQLAPPQFSTIGTDKYGNPVHGFVNPYNKTTEPAGVMAGQQIGAGGQIPNAAGGEGLPHGPDFLKTLAPAEADQVKALAEGRMAFPAGFALKSPYWQRMITNVSQYDPSFDAVNYNARSKTRNDFTSGKSAQSINALNTVIGHMQTLSDAADNLNNTSYPSYNRVANFMASETGDPRIKQFDATKKAVVDELTRVYRGSGGSEGDIKMWSDQINAANSPEQLHGVIGQVGDLLKSKMDALGEQYKQGMGTTAEPVRLTTPKAEKALEILRQRATGQTAQAPAQAQAGPKPGDVQQGYRFKGGNPADPHSWEKAQ